MLNWWIHGACYSGYVKNLLLTLGYICGEGAAVCCWETAGLQILPKQHEPY